MPSSVVGTMITVNGTLQSVSLATILLPEYRCATLNGYGISLAIRPKGSVSSFMRCRECMKQKKPQMRCDDLQYHKQRQTR